MTLIISNASRYFVLQISDRLVTKSNITFDEFANKSIVFSGLNGILAISYTGLAFIGETPTDQWLSEKLIGETFPNERILPALGFGKTKFVHIGPALNTLKKSLSEDAISAIKPELRQYWIDSPFYLSIAGWLWGSKGFRPIIGWLEKPSRKNDFKLEFNPRHSIYGNKFAISILPTSKKNQETMHNLINLLCKRNINETEKIIIGVMQEISKSDPSVGADYISILIPPPSLAQNHPLLVKYISKSGAGSELLKT